MESKFLTDLKLRDLNEGDLDPALLKKMQVKPREVEDRFAELLEDLVYQSELYGDKIVVPKHFITDKASTPRVPIVFWMFGDRAHREAVVHDYLYQTHLVSKSKADKIFLEAMKARNKSGFVRWGMYSGVFVGGRSSYKSGPNRFVMLGNNE